MECYYCLTDRERELYYDGLEPWAAKEAADPVSVNTQ